MSRRWLRGLRLRGLRLALIGLALGSVAPATAMADEASEAQFHYDVASRHYAAQRYREAIRYFFLVRRSAHNPRIDYNLALCFDQLSRRCRAGERQCELDTRQTYHWYSTFLASEDTDATRRTEARSRVEALRQRVALVRVESDPEGADILIDRREIGSYGETPRVVAIEPGTHSLTIHRDGYRDRTVEVEAVRGQEVGASVQLERIVGMIRITAPVEAQIEIRDSEGASLIAGQTQVGGVLPPGSYRISVDAEGHETWRDVVEIEAEQETVVEPELSELPRPTTELTVTANVTGAVVRLDGEEVGFTPTLLPGLSLGEHEVQVEHEGLMPIATDLELTGDSRGWLTATLEPTAQTTRSDATWVVGGVGIGALLAGGGLGIWALVTRADYDTAIANGDITSARLLRDQGVGAGIATDVLLGTAVLGLAVATLLYFVTEQRSDRASRAVFSRGER